MRKIFRKILAGINETGKKLILISSLYEKKKRENFISFLKKVEEFHLKQANKINLVNFNQRIVKVLSR